MYRLTIMLFLASVALIPVTGNAQELIDSCSATAFDRDEGAVLVAAPTGGPMPMSLGPREAVDVLIGPPPKPEPPASRDALVQWAITLRGPDGEAIGSSAVEASVSGLARFEISTDLSDGTTAAGDQSAQILVNGQALGPVALVGRRIALQMEICRQRQGRNPQTGEPVVIPAKPARGKGTRVVLSTFDAVTGATRTQVDAHVAISLGDGQIF